MDKVLGARQGVSIASVPRRKGSCEDALCFRASMFLRLHLRNLHFWLEPFYVQQEQEPLDAYRLHPDTCLNEESLTESETRNKRYGKAMTLKLPRSDLDTDLEETQGLLLFQHQADEEERSSRFLRVWFAAESEKQHLSWQSEFAFAS